MTHFLEGNQLPLKSEIYTPSLSQGSQPNRCVVFLHGLGTCGANLIGISSHWISFLPNTLFIAPNAPFEYGDTACDHPWALHASPNPIRPTQAFQWFPPTQDYHTLLPLYAKKSLDQLNTYLNSLIALTSIEPESIALVGFSQGGMMAIQYALYGEHPLAGVISYSGAQLTPQKPPYHRTRICLIHGDDDEVLSSSFFQEAKTYMEQNRVPYEALLIPNLGHSIDEEGLQKGATFLKSVFSL